MEVIYEGDEIADVRIGVPKIQSGLTKPKRVALFGCAHPNATAWGAVVDAERGIKTASEAVSVMVAQGLITQQRADEILA